MRTYLEKNYDRKYVKEVDLQQVGVYYSVPIRDIHEDKRNEFDYEDLDDIISLDKNTIDSGEYIENYDNIDYDYTDELENEDFIEGLMNYQKYNHYLVVLFNSRWNGASGYKVFNNYRECFYRDYEVSMYVVGGSKSGKYLQLREYHHDIPMGHNSIIIGLTESEYEKVENMSIDEVINFGAKYLEKVEKFN